MARRILVPLDGSKLAERALPYATALLRDPQDELLLFCALSPGHLSEGDSYKAPRRDAESYLATTIAALNEAGHRASPHVYVDEPARAVIQAVETLKANLVVMSTHGRGGIDRWLNGSVADEVLRSASVPVLVVPAVCEVIWSGSRPLRIVVPLDGSHLAEEGLRVASSLASEIGASLVLVQAVEALAALAYPGEGLSYIGRDPEQAVSDARAYLEHVAERLQPRGVPVEVVVRQGFAASAIADVAAERRADLVTMATHGRSGLARMLLGSVATAVLQQGSVPVLITRPTVLDERESAPEALTSVSPTTQLSVG